MIARPHDTAFVYSAAYTLFAAFSTGLSRSWQLLQPEKPEAQTTLTSAVIDSAPGA